MANIKISQLPAKGANLASADLLEVSEFTGTGYVSKSITGQEIIDAASGGGTAWGDITGIVSNQTDLQTELDLKQNFLVSGTNIKTINGSSVLGSGDLIVGGSGSITATHVLIKPTSTAYIPNTWVGGTLNVYQINANALNLTAFIPGYDLEFDEISINLSSGSAGLAKVVIYSDLNGKPDALLFESPDVDCTTSGTKLITGINFTFTAFTTYWIATVLDTFGAQFRVFPTSLQVPAQPVIGVTSSGSFSNRTSWYIGSITYSSLPTNITGLVVGNLSAVGIPYLLFRAV